MEDRGTSLTYKEASKLVDEWLTTAEDRYFEARDLYSDFGLQNRESKQSVSQVLKNYVTTGKIDGERGKYRVVNREVEELDWLKADPKDILPIKWPYGIHDGTDFGFDDNFTLYPGSIVVVSGVSNAGKSTFMINMIVMNMDIMPVQYLTNEMGAEEFADRMDKFSDNFDLCHSDGSPKFKVASRYDNYQDVIMPDAMNIIDYLDPGENPYLVGKQIDAMKQRLNRGVIIIALQKKMTTLNTREGIKKVYSDYGTGGQYSEHRARIVIHIEPDHIFIKKAKKCRKTQLGGAKFFYRITNDGAMFAGIRRKYEGDEE